MPKAKAYFYWVGYKSFSAIAETKKDAAAHFHSLQSAADQAETSAASRARWLGQLYYSPQHERLWYRHGTTGDSSVDREHVLDVCWRYIAVKEPKGKLRDTRRATALSQADFDAAVAASPMV